MDPIIDYKTALPADYSILYMLFIMLINNTKVLLVKYTSGLSHVIVVSISNTSHASPPHPLLPHLRSVTVTGSEQYTVAHFIERQIEQLK